jgi:hypothetical protein
VQLLGSSFASLLGSVGSSVSSLLGGVSSLASGVSSSTGGGSGFSGGSSSVSGRSAEQQELQRQERELPQQERREQQGFFLLAASSQGSSDHGSQNERLLHDNFLLRMSYLVCRTGCPQRAELPGCYAHAARGTHAQACTDQRAIQASVYRVCIFFKKVCPLSFHLESAF